MKTIALTLLVLALQGCSLRQYALDNAADLLAEGGSAFSADDDPELIRAAAPFSLKLIESLLAENPQHKGLLLAAARGFTQYAYAFVQQDAEELEEHDLARAKALEDRARRLYRRARDYGLRGLSLSKQEPQRSDVPLLYWTAASWAALIGLSKSEPEMLADLPAVEAMIDRALALDPSFDRGAIHVLMIGYEPVRVGAAGDAGARSQAHFARAIQLADGAHAAPFVALAEAVSVPQQRRAEFEALLGQALRVDLERSKDHRLANLVAQRRARWLLARTARLFTD
jgi:predicted anti-sigma-YlaC factor YlaD